MISFNHHGNFKNTEKFFARALKSGYMQMLEKYGQAGVRALAAATPRESGETAGSWSYSISESNGKVSLYWENSNVVDGVNIAIILQYGHGTRNGGFVKGRNYINPAIRPIFDQLASEAWKEVTAT
jgi:hypothetical protein